MAETARWTTPSVTYKPSMVEMQDVDEIFMVIKQGGSNVIVKDKSESETDETGFIWTLTQEETSLLQARRSAFIQIDYTDTAGNRYTTRPRQYEIVESALNEVI